MLHNASSHFEGQGALSVREQAHSALLATPQASGASWWNDAPAWNGTPARGFGSQPPHFFPQPSENPEPLPLPMPLPPPPPP
eukprot:COSAG02_NODE_25471_length_658_cov_0.579606_2_plen_81_part_01